MSRYSVVIVVFAAAAAVAVLVVDETFLGEVIGVVESAVVMPLVMFVKLDRPNHINASAFFLVSCNAQISQRYF